MFGGDNTVINDVDLENRFSLPRPPAGKAVGRVSSNMRLHVSTNLAASAASALAVCAFLCFAIPSNAQNKITMDDNQFNQWLYQGNGESGGQRFRNHPHGRVHRSFMPPERRTEEQASPCRPRRLTRGSPKRVDDLRSECVGKTYDQNAMNELYQKFEPLHDAIPSRPVGSTSLFAKVVHRTLTPEQRQEYARAEAERRKTSHQAKVRLFVAILEQSCPLKASQRDALVDLLLKETRPATALERIRLVRRRRTSRKKFRQ